MKEDQSLFSEKALLKALKTIGNLYENMYKIAYFEKLKKNPLFQKNEKVSNWKLANFETVENLGYIIPCFLVSEFSILLYNQNQKHGFKKLGKKLQRYE